MPIVEIHQKDEAVLRFEFSGPVEFGRQRNEDPPPYNLAKGTGEDGIDRLVIALQSDASFSRRQVMLEPLEGNKCRITNISKNSCQLDVETLLAPGAACEKKIPFSFALHNKLFRIQPNGSSGQMDAVDLLQSLASFTVTGHSILDQSARLSNIAEGEVHELVNWLQMIMQVLNATIGSEDFLKQAAVAMVDIVGLDSGRVLLFHGSEISVATSHPETGNQQPKWKPNAKILQKLNREKKAVWYSGEASAMKTHLGDKALVAAPIRDSKNNLLGALYGEKPPGQRDPRKGVFEALLVDMIACGVSTGLARQRYEKEAMQARVQFEQFFTPELAQQLAREPDLLQGRQAEVTLLFADVRGFSRISERIGPEGTNRVMNSIFDELSKCVHAETGVLVDFLGDGMLAMWGVPGFQPDHARRCVNAALQMQGKMVVLNEKWRRQIADNLAIGIGINSGKAWVGNTGSSIKFKYGPLGPAVNLASRVEGLTKYLHCSILVTGATKKFLDEDFLTRRVTRTRVTNVQEAVDIYQVLLGKTPGDKELCTVTEEALKELENGEFSSAAKLAGIGIGSFPKDGPLMLILNRAAQEMINPSAQFDKVWMPPGK
ncbi:MAG: adenylate/guanylate cyclase domain-containing protein [Gemmataceae bacterium]|nr:adenylate/guanylate cyclase domain-containing protein [Gemmataceae bacterium]